MFKEIGRSAIAAAIAGVATIFGLSAASWAQPEPQCIFTTGEFDFDFAHGQYPECFRDVVRGAAIKAGVDLGGTGHTSLNIRGAGSPAGRTWMTVVAQDPDGPPDLLYRSGTVCADILMKRVRNTKGAGVAVLYNQGEGKKGLALVLYNAGDSDRLTLATVDGDAKGGLTPLMDVPLGSAIAEKNWYRVVMTFRPGDRTEIEGQAYAHVDGSDPNSAIRAIGPVLRYAPTAFPAGIDEFGESGIIGSAIKAADNSSVTNFTNVKASCVPDS
jgi:hypothetical protein